MPFVMFPRRRFAEGTPWLAAGVGLLILSLPQPAAAQPDESGRVLAADYSTKRIAIVDDEGRLEWEYPIKDIHDAWLLPSGNVLFQTSWTNLLEVTPDKQIVWQYDATRENGNAGRRVEVHSFQRLDNGDTMIAESGPGRIIEVNAKGELQHEVRLKVDRPDPHRDTRLVRKLKNGHYLVCHEGDQVVREYDPAGKVVWEYTVGSAVYSAQRLDDGNTLIGCGDGHRVVEVNVEGDEVWSLTNKDLGRIKLAWVTMVERRPNGNTLIVNCHPGPGQPQMLEVTPEKDVIWTYVNMRHFGNSMPVGRRLPRKAPSKK